MFPIVVVIVFSKAGEGTESSKCVDARVEGEAEDADLYPGCSDLVRHCMKVETSWL